MVRRGVRAGRDRPGAVWGRLPHGAGGFGLQASRVASTGQAAATTGSRSKTGSILLLAASRTGS